MLKGSTKDTNINCVLNRNQDTVFFEETQLCAVTDLPWLGWWYLCLSIYETRMHIAQRPVFCPRILWSFSPCFCLVCPTLSHFPQLNEKQSLAFQLLSPTSPLAPKAKACKCWPALTVIFAKYSKAFLRPTWAKAVTRCKIEIKENSIDCGLDNIINDQCHRGDWGWRSFRCASFNEHEYCSYDDNHDHYHHHYGTIWHHHYGTIIITSSINIRKACKFHNW